MNFKKYVYNALIEEYGVAPEKMYNRCYTGSLDVDVKHDWDVFSEMPENSSKLAYANSRYKHYSELGLDKEAKRWYSEINRLETELKKR